MLPTPLLLWSLLLSTTALTLSLNSLSSVGNEVFPTLSIVRSEAPKTSMMSCGTASLPTQRNCVCPSSMRYKPYGTRRSEERLIGGGNIISPVESSGTPALLGMSWREKSFGQMYCISRGSGSVDKRHKAAERRSEGICEDLRRPTYEAPLAIVYLKQNK